MQAVRGTVGTFSMLCILMFVAAAPSAKPVAACCEPTAAARFALAVAPATQPAGANAAALFEKLKGLEGKWDGEATGETFTFEYTLTAGGTTVVENQNMHGGMMTMYTLDHGPAGDRVLVTHYCAAGNQPRMSSPGLADGRASFEFVDVTGMSSDADPHMHGLKLTFGEDGTVTQDWTMFADAKEAGVVTIKLKKAI